MTRRTAARVRVYAPAKINVGLRVLGVRPDGYHELRTTFRSLALHDTITFTIARGPFTIECDEPGCPTDRTNLVWKAAERLWRAARGRGLPRGVHVHIKKNVPLQAGLGGGSADAAAALRGLSALWGLDLDAASLATIGRSVGADVPFFLEGGTALGVERGDVIFPLVDPAPAYVVLLLPQFGVSTRDAFGWWDADARSYRPRTASKAGELVNDLERPVAARHPVIARLVRLLRRDGASHAGMSGSGSAVFGLFESARVAYEAAGRAAGPNRRAIITRTLTRREYAAVAKPRAV